MFNHSHQCLICLNTRKWYSQPEHVFSHSCQQFWTAQIIKSNLQSRCMFSHSQWFWSAQTMENSQAGNIQPVLIIDLMPKKNWKSDSHAGHINQSHQWLWSFQTKHWRMTHILDIFQIYHISKIHFLHVTILPFCPSKKKSLIRFQ